MRQWFPSGMKAATIITRITRKPPTTNGGPGTNIYKQVKNILYLVWVLGCWSSLRIYDGLLGTQDIYQWFKSQLNYKILVAIWKTKILVVYRIDFNGNVIHISAHGDQILTWNLERDSNHGSNSRWHLSLESIDKSKVKSIPLLSSDRHTRFTKKHKLEYKIK